jgi:hypothetical protein
VYGWLILAAIVLGLGLRTCSRIEEEATKQGFAKADAQIAASIKEGDADIKRELAALDTRRAVRATATEATQKARATSETKQRTTDKTYGDWAFRPVPQSVVDELRLGSAAANGVRRDATDGGNAQSDVRPESAAATGKDGQRAASALQLGPAGRNR